MRVWRFVPVLLTMVLLFPSCGDNGGNGPDNVTTTTTSVLPSRAEISISVSNAFAIASGQGNLFIFDMTMTESGGVGANINFARLEIFRATGEREEAREIGASDIIAGSGDNRLEANTSETVNVAFFFRATIKRGRAMRLTVGFSDDRGNAINVVEDFVFT